MPSSIEHKEIGHRIELRRKALDLTLSDVASEVGVAASTIQRYEKGLFEKIKMPVIEAIASALHVNPAWLIGEDDDPIDYEDGDLIASIPLAYMEACDGDTRRAYKMMMAVDEDILREASAVPYHLKNIQPLPESVSLPLLGSIACGEPILAEENVEDYIPVPKAARATYVLRCKGDSMIGAHISDGDLVYIRQQDDVENGQIAAILIDDEATLKRVYKHADRVILAPENPAYSPMVYAGSEQEAVRIIGLAVGYTHYF